MQKWRQVPKTTPQPINFTDPIQSSSYSYIIFSPMLFSISFLSSSKTALIISMSISISMAMAVSSSEPHATKPSASLTAVTETAKCFSCGFTEECTPSYVLRIRERYEGRWLCGLCIEAVKDEVVRSEKLISVKEALERHISFCLKFREPFHEEDPISAMGRVLRRSMDSDSPRRRTLRSGSSTSLPDTGDLDVPPPPVRSGSCFSSLSS